MADVKLRKWYVVNYLETDERMVGYGESLLEKAIEESYRLHSHPSDIVPAEMQMS